MEKTDASIKPYYIMDKKGNKTVLFIDVAAFKDVVDAFEDLQSEVFTSQTLAPEPEYLTSEVALKKALPQ